MVTLSFCILKIIVLFAPRCCSGKINIKDHSVDHNAFGYKSFDKLRKRVLYIEREKLKKTKLKKLVLGLFSQPEKTPVDFKVPKSLVL